MNTTAHIKEKVTFNDFCRTFVAYSNGRVYALRVNRQEPFGLDDAHDSWMNDRRCWGKYNESTDSFI